MPNNRKPRHIKEAQGTLRNYRENNRQLLWNNVEEIPDPEYCEGAAAAYYYRMTSALQEAGALAKVFIPGIERAAFWYGLFSDARDHIRKNGYTQKTQSGYSQITAHVTVMQTAHKHVTEFEKSFGLDLVNSQKLEMKQPGLDDLDELLK